MKSIALPLLAIILLTGCSNDTETYLEKIQRFEKGVVSEQTFNSRDAAIALANKKIENVDIITFDSQPIPIIYKKKYEEMGFDTSQLSFYTPTWKQDQDSYNIEQIPVRADIARAAKENAGRPSTLEDYSKKH